MRIPEYKDQLASSFRQVQVSSSGEQVTPLKVTPAGNLTLIGLSFYPVLHLQPVDREPAKRS